MIRGISAEAEGGVLLKKIMQSIDCAGHNWYVDESISNPFPLVDGEYKGNKILTLIDELSVISEFSFLRLRRYPEECAVKEVEKIATYDDFLKSQCDFLALYYDAYYYFLYAKDLKLINRVYRMLRRNNFASFIITDLNDPRRNMYT